MHREFLEEEKKIQRQTRPYCERPNVLTACYVIFTLQLVVQILQHIIAVNTSLLASFMSV